MLMGEMRFYYIHPESCCAFTCYDPPDMVIGGDGCVMEVDRQQYLQACKEWGIEPDADESRETLTWITSP